MTKRRPRTSRRHARSGYRVIALFVAVLMAAAADATRPDHASTRSTAWQPPVRPPAGCAIGSSGPTLAPGRAVSRARHAALRNLALETLRLRIRSETILDTAGRTRASTRQLARGRLQGADVSALWSAETEIDGRIRREVFALACTAGADGRLPTPLRLGMPPRGRICAIGFAGPTSDAERQQASLVRDARRTLAEALESRIAIEIADDGRSTARVVTALAATPDAIARVAAASALQASWLDHRGDGPVQRAGVLYGRVCLDGERDDPRPPSRR